MSKTVTGTEAISKLVSHTFYKELARITETRAFIDVDDAGRMKEWDSDSDYVDLMWTVLNYHPNKHDLRHTGYSFEEAIDLLYSAGIEEREINGRTQETITWFFIRTSIYDSESLGQHYEFTYE